MVDTSNVDKPVNYNVAGNSVASKHAKPFLCAYDATAEKCSHPNMPSDCAPRLIPSAEEHPHKTPH
jgi:hypothetical protein